MKRKSGLRLWTGCEVGSVHILISANVAVPTFGKATVSSMSLYCHASINQSLHYIIQSVSCALHCYAGPACVDPLQESWPRAKTDSGLISQTSSWLIHARVLWLLLPLSHWSQGLEPNPAVFLYWQARGNLTWATVKIHHLHDLLSKGFVVKTLIISQIRQPVGSVDSYHVPN